MRDLIQIYDTALSEHSLTSDPKQLGALHALSAMMAQAKRPKVGFVQKLFSLKSEESAKQGVYLYGDVGRGKTFIMDLFYESVENTPKKRLHFNEFMIGIHDHMHQQRKDGADKHMDADLLNVARDIAKETKLLCFDEMYVDDVADAMLLGRLFTALFEAGVFIVMTSNIKPENLYPNGLQRERFIPFIDVLNDKMEVIFFDGGLDYRSEKLRDQNRYIYPLNARSKVEMIGVFKTLSDGQDGGAYMLQSKGRSIELPRVYKRTAMVDFERLCGQALGAGDYLALAAEFNTVILTDIPVLNDDLRNDVKRFITLIDTLYEKDVSLFCSAETGLEDLYQGTQYQKQFKRTKSRLTEMQAVL